ncbi:MAG TPA: hypothetical protein VE153_24870 [Myxococcus sp.]|nr:hypothetical protein [Myxococcus sp.]
MKQTAMGVLAALVLSAPALAQDEEGARGEPRELTARVIGAASGYMHVESAQGAVIPVRVTHATRVGGERIPRSKAIAAWLSRELEMGEEVRVRFDVRFLRDGTPENVASHIDPP